MSAQPEMRDGLHVVKWGAYATWRSGSALLALIYYVGAKLYLIDPEKVAFPHLGAVAAGVACIAAGMLVSHVHPEYRKW